MGRDFYCYFKLGSTLTPGLKLEVVTARLLLSGLGRLSLISKHGIYSVQQQKQSDSNMINDSNRKFFEYICAYWLQFGKKSSSQTKTCRCQAPPTNWVPQRWQKWSSTRNSISSPFRFSIVRCSITPNPIKAFYRRPNLDSPGPWFARMLLPHENWLP